MGRGGGNLEYRAPLEAGAYRGSALWSRFGEGRGCGSGGHPRRGHQPPAAGSVVLRPLREQAARAWSHLHVPEQFVLMVTGTVAGSRGLSLTVMVGVHQRQVAALAGANASGNALSSDAAITGTLTEVACQTPWPHAAAAALVLAGCGERRRRPAEIHQYVHVPGARTVQPPSPLPSAPALSFPPPWL